MYLSYATFGNKVELSYEQVFDLRGDSERDELFPGASEVQHFELIKCLSVFI